MENEKKRIIQISDQLTEASSSVRILRNIAWPLGTKEEFFSGKEQKLPAITYAQHNPKPTLDLLKKIRENIGSEDNILNNWALNITRKIESAALLLSTRGTEDFFRHSVDLYGKPTDQLQNGTHTALQLAKHFEDIFDQVKDIDFGTPPAACVLSHTLVEVMKKVVKENFGSLAPEILLDETIASNALAGRRRVFIKPTACFTDKDVDQLIQHELFVHVSTSLNGHEQPFIKILGEGHSGTTKTQEGLAIFAEYITGTIDLDRTRRLSDRVIAIQMAIDGANFIDVYRHFLEKTDSKDQSFENAKRVFRGGLVTGKAPFTKDIVYLEGLLLVHNFLRVAITSGKLEYLDLLFTGKMDISDLPAIKALSTMGLIQKPMFVPAWIKDKRFLLSYLSYSSFLNEIDLSQIKEYYKSILQ
jgi:uncharacterized protein (TIGR02421 family)